MLLLLCVVLILCGMCRLCVCDKPNTQCGAQYPDEIISTAYQIGASSLHQVHVRLIKVVLECVEKVCINYTTTLLGRLCLYICNLKLVVRVYNHLPVCVSFNRSRLHGCCESDW